MPLNLFCFSLRSHLFFSLLSKYMRFYICAQVCLIRGRIKLLIHCCCCCLMQCYCRQQHIKSPKNKKKKNGKIKFLAGYVVARFNSLRCVFVWHLAVAGPSSSKGISTDLLCCTARERLSVSEVPRKEFNTHGMHGVIDTRHTHIPCDVVIIFHFAGVCLCR